MYIPPAGLEPATLRLEVLRSVQLSQEGFNNFYNNLLNY